MSVEESLRLAADIHKRVRRKLRESNLIAPGTSLADIANFIETRTKEYTVNLLHSLNYTGRNSDTNPKITAINGGIGFPVGLSINECAAHYHPHSSACDKLLSNSDILKVDFGTEINGWIIDSAFTTRVSGPPSKTPPSFPSHSFTDDECDSLILCMKEATETGIRNIGIDGSISDWSASIEEVIRSYDDVYPVYNLTGHDIKHEIIHGDVRLPSVCSAVDNKNERFKEGVYAIETFGAKFGKGSRASYKPTTNSAEVHDLGESTIFRLNPELARYSAQELQTQFHTPIFKIQSVQKVFSQICKRFRTLPFAERYLQPSDRTPLSVLVKNGVVLEYPPLCIDPGSITAQFEHTVLLKDSDSGRGTVTVFSRDDDY
jgi:methionyl aminopeptidase